MAYSLSGRNDGHTRCPQNHGDKNFRPLFPLFSIKPPNSKLLLPNPMQLSGRRRRTTLTCRPASVAGRSNPAEQDYQIDLIKKFPEQSGKQSGIGHSNPDSTNQ
jgi:hypothetical protein